ncbi:hypothetical protein CPB86DRAFT_803103 [Serendipita vermifera]|nr:hypothetical protein CPB86DRAFT_803103 [Serendipita vermifera]
MSNLVLVTSNMVEESLEDLAPDDSGLGLPTAMLFGSVKSSSLSIRIPLSLKTVSAIAVREMHESPKIGIIQHDSADVMQVAHTYFENGITHLSYQPRHLIRLRQRWSAIQEVAFVGPADGERKIWLENNVSEDFDMALRLQLGGYTAWWAVYSDGGFKEGISLTENTRMAARKSNPFIEWPTKGPINTLIHKMFWSPTPAHYKIGMLAYMFTYYGIAATFLLSFFNYLFVGWRVSTDAFPPRRSRSVALGHDRVPRRWQHFVLLARVSSGPSFIFFGGLSINLSKAMLAHMFSYDILWGATKKEVERSNFFMQVPKTFNHFRVALFLSVITLSGIIILATPLVLME